MLSRTHGVTAPLEETSTPNHNPPASPPDPRQLDWTHGQLGDRLRARQPCRDWMKEPRSAPPARYNGPCPWCRKPVYVGPKPGNDDGYWEYIATTDPRVQEEAYHQVPACSDWRDRDLVDLCLMTIGIGPTPVKP